MTLQKNFNCTSKPNRAGLSLIEVLIGLTVTLIVLGSMAGAFRFASQEMAKGRASLELTNRLRIVENLFRDDLRRMTVELKPFHRLPAFPQGYAEIIDGVGVDSRNLRDDLITTPNRDEGVANLFVGDYDDIFAATIRSDGKAFRGRFDVDGDGLSVTTTIEESHVAEVIWFATYADADGNGFVEPDLGDRIRLYRRQLIVKPTLTHPLTGSFNLGEDLSISAVNQFIQHNDISVRVEETSPGSERYNIRPNSLQDLTFRGNRFAHFNGDYPQTSALNLLWLINDDQYQASATPNTPIADFDLDSSIDNDDLFPHRRASDQSDLMLTDLAAFDIKVFAPDAVSLVTFGSLPAGAPVPPIADLAEPSDLAWRIASLTVGRGEFDAGFDGEFYGNGRGTFALEIGPDGTAAQKLNRVGAYVDLGKGAAAGSDYDNAPSFGSAAAQSSFQFPPRINYRVSSTPTRPQLNYLFSTPLTTVAEHVFDTGTSAYDSVETATRRPLGNNGLNDVVTDNDDRTPPEPTDEQIDNEDEKIQPPYGSPIRGIKVTFRVYEPNSSQAKQLTLKQSFLPQ